jgi:hypothetical protein
MKNGEELDKSEHPAGSKPENLLQKSIGQASVAEQKARRWASLLTDNPGMLDSSLEDAREHLIYWLVQSAEETLIDLSDFPEAFQTTRFWHEIKTVEGPFRFLKAALDGLRSGDLSFMTAIDHIGRNFGWDEERLLNWKLGLENLAGLKRWLPFFAHAYEYLSAAFPLGDEKIDCLRSALLQSIGESHRFIQPNARNEFDDGFLEFKKNYMDAYFLLHEDALHVIGGIDKEEIRIDPAALRNLEFLSGLQYSDKSYLNRVKLLAKWIQQNQCNLPLNQILELYPRCYCNFNPSGQQQPSSSAAQINGIIQEGLEYFRTLLRRHDQLILQELDAQPIDENSQKQIREILGNGPMIPLKAQSIEILNRIIAQNSGEFLSEIRKSKRLTSVD